MTRKKEIFCTIFFNFFLQIVTAVCGFILPPIVIKTFGSSINGMVASITQFISYLNLVEVGVGGAAIVALYKPLAENDINERNAILSATKGFFNKSGLLFSSLVIILSIIYPLLVSNEVKKSDAGLMVLVLGITGAAEFFLIGKYRVLLTADKKLYVISLTQIIAVIVNTVAAIILIKLGFGILIVKLCSSLIYLSRYFLIRAYVKNKYPDLDLRVKPDKLAISHSKNVFVHSIAGFVVFNSPLVIITLFCSLKDASVYAVYAMIFAALNSLLSSFTTGMQSFLGESLVKNDMENLRRQYNLFETTVFLITFWTFSMAYILLPSFISIYTRELNDANYQQKMLGILFCVVGLMNNLRMPGVQLINGAGHFKETQNRALLETIINLLGSVIFTILFGFRCILIGSILSYGYRFFDIIIYSNRRILKEKSIKSFIKIVVLLLIFIAITFLINFFKVNITSYLNWMIYGVCVGFVYAVPVIPVLIKNIRKLKKW